MPVTKGAGNPDWSWDETLLALDLLYRHGGPTDRHHPDVQALSNVLRAAELHPKEGRKSTFRNPDGVGLKLQNLLSAIDPARGLSSSKTDKAVVAAYPENKKEELAGVASAILKTLSVAPSPEQVPEDELFKEGRVITASHRSRDRRLRRRLLDKCSDAKLVCSLCEFRPPALERHFRESFFEAHHVLPLSQIAGETQTRVSDMVLLCAGCHRFVHRLIAHRKEWVTVEDSRTELMKARGEIG